MSHEAKYTGERVLLSLQEANARRRRSVWIAALLGVFVLLVFAITLVRLGVQSGGAS